MEATKECVEGLKKLRWVSFDILDTKPFLYALFHLQKKPKVFPATVVSITFKLGKPPGSGIGALGLATGGTAHGRCWSRKAGFGGLFGWGLVLCWIGEWTVALGKKSQTEHVFLSFLRLVAAEEQV